MRKIFPVVFGILIFVVAAVAQDVKPTPKDDEVVRISTDLIQLDVTVTDKKGKVITDLTRDELEIYENGEKQNITNFSFVSTGKRGEPASSSTTSPTSTIPAGAPVQRTGGPDSVRRTIALVVDDLTLSYESINVVRRSLKKFIDEQMQEGDLVTIIRVGAGSGVLQQFTSDKRVLYAALERVRFNPLGRGRISAFEQITDVPGSLKDPKYGGGDSPEEMQFKKAFEDFRESAYGAGTLGTLKFMVSAMREMPGRKSVVLFSDGFSIFEKDEHGYTQGGKVSEILRLLIEAANRASVVFYTVDARTLQNPTVATQDSISLPAMLTRSHNRFNATEAQRTTELFDTQGGLDRLAAETGGFSIKNQNNVSEGLERVLVDQSYYLIGYEPDTETFDAKARKQNKIEIKIKRDGLTARYRSGFFGITDEDLNKTKQPKTANAQDLEQIITSPFAASSISLRLNTVFGNSTSGNYVIPLLNIDARDLKFTETSNGERRIVLDVLAMSFGSDGVPIEKTSKTVTFEVKPELYEKLLKTGFVLHFNFPVKDPGGYQFRVAVRDKQAQTTGTASQFVEIPDLKKNRLIMSGILLENFTAEQWGTFSGEIKKAASTKELTLSDGTDPMNDTSRRRFAKNTVLRYGFEIYNSGLADGKKTGLFTKIKVFRDGVAVLDGTEIPVDTTGQNDMKRIQVGGAMNLPRDMPAGEYILQIIVTTGSGKAMRETTAQAVQFEIVG